MLGEPQSMQQHSELAGDRDGGAFLGGFAAPLGELEAVSSQVAVGSEGAEDVVRGWDEQLAHEGIGLPW